MDKLHKLIHRLVDSVENKHSVDQEIVSEILSLKPQAKPIVEDLIHQLRIYSVYDTDPTVVNFDYQAYINKIENTES